MRVRNGPSPTKFHCAMLDRSHQGCTTYEAAETIILADANARRSRSVGVVTEPMALQPSVQDIMLAAVPNLRAFAMSLSGNAERADDLVQGALLRAIASINSFKPGTNMSAWLFTILRNLFRSEYRKRRREVEDPDGSYLASLKAPPEQFGRLEFKELVAALAKLPHLQREAVLLVGASGFSYDEAAAICGVAVGTIKSRVNRARRRLAELLVIDSADKLGPNPTSAELRAE
jgi:RNA polymerase sigma-70 factor, ECF subfamily